MFQLMKCVELADAGSVRFAEKYLRIIIDVYIGLKAKLTILVCIFYKSQLIINMISIYIYIYIHIYMHIFFDICREYIES